MGELFKREMRYFGFRRLSLRAALLAKKMVSFPDK